MIIETERLLLREYTMDDFDALYEIKSDAETIETGEPVTCEDYLRLILETTTMRTG